MIYDFINYMNFLKFIMSGYLIVNRKSYRHISTYDIYIPSVNIVVICSVEKSTKRNFDKSFRIIPCLIKPKSCNKVLYIHDDLLKLTKLEKLYTFLNTQLIQYIFDIKHK